MGLKIMESPIQLKFFKKLELYQELKSQNKKSLNRDEVWPIEKEILKWTRWRHHHLSTPLTDEYIFSRNNEVLPSDKVVAFVDVKTAMSNLVARGYARYGGDGILITHEGLLMGEVIDDIEGIGAQNYLGDKYSILYYFVWTVTILGGATIILNFIYVLCPFIHHLIKSLIF